MAAAIPVLIAVSAAAAIGGTVVSAVGQQQQAKAQAKAVEAQRDAEAAALQDQARAQQVAAEEAARQAEANARIASQQAELARTQALEERRRATIEAEIFAREARRKQGTRVSSIMASGITLSGGALDVLADAAMSDEQGRLFIVADGEAKARARLAGATVEELSAAEFTRQAAAQREAGAAAVSGLEDRARRARSIGRQEASALNQAGAIGATGTLLTGFSSTGLTLSQSPSVRRAFG